MKRKLLFKIFLAIWLAVWFHTLVIKPQSHRKRYQQYANLWGLTHEEKIEYLIGPALYEFIQFCQEQLPEKSHYRMEGLHMNHIGHIRLVYYLYPHLEYRVSQPGNPPDYILVFNQRDHREEGYSLFQKLDDERYILKRKGI